MSDASAIPSAVPSTAAARSAALVHGLEIHLQPVVEVATGRTVAVEALARFRQVPERPVAAVLAEAHAKGYGYLVEAACLRAALARRPDLPHGIRLMVNVSPDVVRHPLVARAWPDDLARVVVEVTEHHASNPAALADQFVRLRERGARIAVDDVGSGYAGLLRLATLRPDVVKVDRSIVTGVGASAPKAAVLEALVAFSHRVGAAVIGEGVESFDDLAALADFDVDYAQGFAIGRPTRDYAPVSDDVVAGCQRIRSAALQRRVTTTSAAGDIELVNSMSSAVAGASGLAELHVAVAHAASELAIDAIGVSVVGDDGVLREITSSGAAIDTVPYSISEYPATQAVLDGGSIVEVHVNDPSADPAEVAVLRRLGQASLLMLPFSVAGRRIGVLEFGQHTHRRWTSRDIAHAQGLANHLAHALERLT